MQIAGFRPPQLSYFLAGQLCLSLIYKGDRMMAQKDQCHLKRSILLLTLLLEMRGMPHVRRQKERREGLAKDFTGVPTRMAHGAG